MPEQSNQANYPWQCCWNISEGEKEKTQPRENWINIINHRQESAINDVCFLSGAECRRQAWGLSDRCRDPGCPLRGQASEFSSIQDTSSFIAICGGWSESDNALKIQCGRVCRAACVCVCVPSPVLYTDTADSALKRYYTSLSDWKHSSSEQGCPDSCGCCVSLFLTLT